MSIQIPGVHTLSPLTSSFLLSLAPTETSRLTALRHSIWACWCFRVEEFVFEWTQWVAASFLSRPNESNQAAPRHDMLIRYIFVFGSLKEWHSRRNNPTFCARTRQKKPSCFWRGLHFNPFLWISAVSSHRFLWPGCRVEAELNSPLWKYSWDVDSLWPQRLSGHADVMLLAHVQHHSQAGNVDYGPEDVFHAYYKPSS